MTSRNQLSFGCIGLLAFLSVSYYLDIPELDVIDADDIGTIVYGKVENKSDRLLDIAIIVSTLDDKGKETGRNKTTVRLGPESLEVFWIVVKPGIYSKNYLLSRQYMINGELRTITDKMFIRYKENAKVQAIITKERNIYR